jgi:hypothetical protein
MGQQVSSARILGTTGTEVCFVPRLAVRKLVAAQISGITFDACLIKLFQVML